MSDVTVSRQARDTISRFFALRQTSPDAQKLADKFDVPLPRAQGWIEDFLTTNGVPVAPMVHEKPSTVVVNDPEPKLSMVSKKFNISRFMNSLIDSGSLWFAVVIDLVLNGIGFWIIGPDPVMKVGTVCVSVIVVLFSVRAWIKRDKMLWAMFALVASFMDTSFILLATDVQSQNSSVDTELVRLTDAETKAQGYLDSLQAKQLDLGQGYAQQIKDAREALGMATKARSDWASRPREGGEIRMTASKVFTAIPDAISSMRWDRWIALALFVLVFLGLQLTIISATGVKWNEAKTQHQSP